MDKTETRKKKKGNPLIPRTKGGLKSKDQSRLAGGTTHTTVKLAACGRELPGQREHDVSLKSGIIQTTKQ
jgi:hypothetical protein